MFQGGCRDFYSTSFSALATTEILSATEARNYEGFVLRIWKRYKFKISTPSVAIFWRTEYAATSKGKVPNDYSVLCYLSLQISFCCRQKFCGQQLILLNNPPSNESIPHESIPQQPQRLLSFRIISSFEVGVCFKQAKCDYSCKCKTISLMNKMAVHVVEPSRKVTRLVMVWYLLHNSKKRFLLILSVL